MRGKRKRYVLFRVISDGPDFDRKQLTTAIWENLLSLFGEVEVSRSKFYLNEYNPETGIGVLQCNLESLENVLASVALLQKIGDSKISIEPQKTSGTLKGLRS